MTKEEAASLIKIIAESLRDNPSQFQTNVHVSVDQGTSFVKSCVVDLSSYHGDVQVKIAQEAARHEINAKMQAAIDSLNIIVTQLRSPTPDRTTISTCLRTLKDNWLPQVLISIVANLISAVLGIGTVG